MKMPATTAPTNGLRRGQVIEDFNAKRAALRRSYPVAGLNVPVNSLPPPAAASLVPQKVSLYGQ